MTTVVAIGSSTARDYSFLLPFTCLFWREVAGHVPLALLIGDEEEWRSGKARVPHQALVDLGVDFRVVPRVGDYHDSTLAQNVRQHAAALSWIPDDTWIMMSDADLWPLRRDYYHQHVDRSGIRAACYGANGDHFLGKQDVLRKVASGEDFQSIPTCHIAMRAREWRALYDPVPDDLGASIVKTLGAWLPPAISRDPKPDREDWHAWMSDQRIVTHKLCQQDWFPGDAALFHRRGVPPVDRLDRNHLGDWVDTFDATRWVDAHLLRAPDEDGQWEYLLPIVDHLLPEYAGWAREYRAEYARAEEG